MTRPWTKTITRLLVLVLQCACWVVVGAWLVGRIASDRFLWSQFLSWIPTIVPLAAAIVVWMLAILAPRDHKPGALLTNVGAAPARRRGAGAMSFFSLPAIAAISVVAWLAVIDIRVHAIFTGFGSSKSPVALRLLCWNATTASVPQMASLVKEHRPDIAILSNTPFSASLVPVRDAMSAAAKEGNKEPATYVASSIRLNVISRFPVLHHAVMPLRISGAKERTFTWVGGGMKHIDTGQLMCVALDTTKGLGRPTVLWVVDLPSDPDIPRARMMREFESAVASFGTTIMRRAEDGLDRVVPPGDRARVLASLKHPDIIAGDFNTTRDSASLARFLDSLGSFEHAKAQSTGAGGVGWDFTYPRTFPVLHIDHVFVSTTQNTNNGTHSLRAKNYNVLDPDVGRHCVQVVDME